MKLKYLAITTALIVSGNAFANNLQIPDSNAAWYYGVGGQRTMTAPASPITNSIILGVALTVVHSILRLA